MRKLLPLLLAVCASAQAQMVVSALDGAVIRVSASEPNLIEASEGRISAFVFTEGRFTQTIDHDAGVVYFRPLEQGPRSGFVEVVRDGGERDRYSLILIPDEDWPAQRVILQSGNVDQEEAKGEPAQAARLPEGHVGSIKEVIRVLLTGKDGRRITVPAAELAIDDLVLTRLSAVEHAGLTGEVLRLENRSQVELRIDEAFLHTSDDIVAVALPDRTVGPGSAVVAYLVRRAPNAGGVR